MKTPSFWKTKNLISVLLCPLGKLYALATCLRLRLVKPKKVDVPVICVGNLTAGGTGKTPVSIALAELLQKNNKTPFFVSRGYGGRLKNIVVNPCIHKANECGDEPLLLSAQASVVVNPNRFEGANTAVNCGADVIIMDDGFQNPTLHKDLSFLVFDGAYGIGNGYAIPAGPLRENFIAGLKRAQAIIIIGEDKFSLAKKINLPCFKGTISTRSFEIANRNVFAFAGIGNPQKFYNSLKNCGLSIVETRDFPDHHFYTTTELEEIIKLAKSKNVEIFTTSKDFVKIPTELQSNFNVLEIFIDCEKPQQLTDFILQNI